MSTPASTGLAEATAAHPVTTVPQGALRLDDWGVIRARGEDAGTFLQGQLTNDVLGLGAGEARLAGYCAAKGRLMATFVVWRDESGDVLLACSADLLAATLKRLSMFVLRAKCKLSDASGEVPLWGVAGDAAMAALGSAAPAKAWGRASLPDGQGAVIRLPDARVGEAAVPRLLLAASSLPLELPALNADAWRWLEAKSGAARIVAATVEQFVPQMVNLEVVGGVSFSKGCYPGQEVVARTKYLGKVKRRTYRGHLLTDCPPAGADLFSPDLADQSCGKVIDSAPAPSGGCEVLASMLMSSAETGEVRVGSADGPRLTSLALPYALE